MRFLKVTAHHFGALTEATIEFAEGMTVVCGPNEAGKSTWHAALYAALCGLRRGRGAPKKEDQRFCDRHRPWDGERWEVSGEIVLADGRHIELHHDLDGKVDSRATDMVIGTDVSAEIIHDGAPDGSRWLGLDRRAFLATACVRQAEVVRVAEEPQLLQEHMQRAAATAGADETAAQALERLKSYDSEYVGLDRANSSRPLRAAKNDLAGCRRAVEEANKELTSFSDLVERAEEASNETREARIRLDQARAADALDVAERAEMNATQAAELAKQFPDGKPPSREDDEAIERRARASLQAWDSRAEPENLTGDTAEELERQLNDLPPMPEGDLEPADETQSRHEGWVGARADLSGIKDAEPETPGDHETTLSESELRDLAHELGLEAPESSDALQGEVKEMESALAGISSTIAYGVMGVGAVIGLLGVAASLLRSASPAMALVAIIGGVAIVVIGGLRLRAGATRRNDVRSKLNDLLRQRDARSREVDEFQLHRQRTVVRLRSEGLEPDAAWLRDRADRLATAKAREQQHKEWERRLVTAQAELETVANRLATVLRERGVHVGADLERAWSAYVQACRDRDRQAERARRRPDLERSLETRRQMERRHADDVSALGVALQGLNAAATECGIDSHQAAAALYEGIEQWLAARDAELARYDDDVRRWEKLQSLLGAGTLKDLNDAAAELRDRAVRMVEALQAQGTQPNRGDIEALDAKYQKVSHRRSGTEGEIKRAASMLPDLADAEARLAEAERELERVERLQATLAWTRQFLAEAQEQVQRDIAPKLSAEVERYLPALTHGRYSGVRVNPDNLQIQVRDGGNHWRHADRLSHGTQEQIYLLLRAAMARLLTKNGETCPLIFDDVTVHSDERRTWAVLDMLHELSAEQQVIVFSQEREVLQWAQANLAERDRLVELTLVESEGGNGAINTSVS